MTIECVAKKAPGFGCDEIVTTRAFSFAKLYIMTYEYILVALLDDYAAGDTFTAWPLHATLVTWFDPHDEAALSAKLRTIASETSAITSRVGERRTWGPNIVNVIDRTPELNTLHQRLLAAVTTHAQLLTNQQYMGDNYTPHVTHQGGLSVVAGENIEISRVYLIKKQPKLREKTVVEHFELLELRK